MHRESGKIEAHPHIKGQLLRTSLRKMTVAWLFGAAWLSLTSGAPITLFAKSLNASNFQFGLLAALPFMASLLSLPASVLTERTGKRKTIFLAGLYMMRWMWVPIAVVPVLLVKSYGLEARWWIVIVFLVMMFVMHSGQAIGGPPWMGWMADIVPKRIRGKYFARRRAIAMLTSVPAAVIAGWILDRYTPNTSPLMTMSIVGWIFFVAALPGVIDIVVFQFIPEVPTAPRPDAHLRGTLGEPLRDREYMWFAGFVASMTFAVSFMGQFVTLYLIDRIGVTNMGTQMMLLVAPSLAQMLFLPVWGKLVDRMGKKPALAIASLGLVPVGLGWCLMNSGLVWLGYVLSSLGAVFYTGVEIANSNMMLELAGSRDRQGRGGSGYVAVNSVITSIAGFSGGLSSGIIAEWLGNDWSMNINMLGISSITFYEVLFALSALFRLVAAVVFLPKIHEPDARPAHVALRYMTANIYNNLFSAVMLPVRLMRRQFGEDEE